MGSHSLRTARWTLLLAVAAAAAAVLSDPEHSREQLLAARRADAHSRGRAHSPGAAVAGSAPSRARLVQLRLASGNAPVPGARAADSVSLNALLAKHRSEPLPRSLLFVEAAPAPPEFPNQVPPEQSSVPAYGQTRVTSPAGDAGADAAEVNTRAAGDSPWLPESPSLHSQLAEIQRRIEELAQSRRHSHDWDRAAQVLAQLQQAQQIQRLEAELQRLQQHSSDPMPPPGPPLGEWSRTRSEPPETSSGGAVQPPAAAPPPRQQEPPPAPPPPADSARQPQIRAEPSHNGVERFSLKIQDAELAEVLQMLGQLAGLNILVGRGVEGRVSATLNGVTVDEALTGLLRSHGYAFERNDRFLFVMTAAEAAQRKLLTRQLVTKVFRPHYISVKELQALVSPLLTPQVGKIAVTNPAETGISPDATSAGGDALAQRDALLVQDYDEVIAEIEALLIELDVPPLQVVIEAMILSVKLTDSMEFGVNFALLNGTSNNLFVSGNGQMLNNASGFPGGRETIVPPLAEFLANTAGLKYGFIQGDITGFIKALETITDTNLIASPQLRVLNKQKAELHIGNRLSYRTTTQNGTSSTENVNFLDVGTKLIIRPYVAPDGLVRMEVHPERSSGSINASGLPDTSTTEVTTNVMVRDGTTVVIGGLIEEQVVESQGRIPFLGALPIVGNLFRNKTEQIDRTELIVLITPRVVVEPEAVAEGHWLDHENHRRAEHFRNSLSPVNRRNLARMHYERALEYYDAGAYERADRHVHWALRYSKNDADALRLHDVIAQETSCRFGDGRLERSPVVNRGEPRPADSPATSSSASSSPATSSSASSSPASSSPASFSPAVSGGR